MARRPWLLAVAAPAALVFVAPTFAVAEASAGHESPAAAALARLAALTGDWKGTAVWTGGRSGSYAMDATYSTTGGGSAVVETLTQDGVPMMTTVYHADGPDLRMTHYCAARNQPRLKASKIDLTGGAIDFAFVDATNLSSRDAPHVTGLEVRFGDADHLTITFQFEGGGKPAREKISLHRARARA
jgi:hypothetical protein